MIMYSPKRFKKLKNNHYDIISDIQFVYDLFKDKSSSGYWRYTKIITKFLFIYVLVRVLFYGEFLVSLW